MRTFKFDLGPCDEFAKQIELMQAKLDLQVSYFFQGWTQRLFRELLMGTPQWSSDLVRSWNYSTDAPDYSYTPSGYKDEPLGGGYGGMLVGSKAAHFRSAKDFAPLHRGYLSGVEATMQKASLAYVDWRQKVYFTNPAPIAAQVEAHAIKIRPINLVNGQVAMVQHMVAVHGGTP